MIILGAIIAIERIAPGIYFRLGIILAYILVIIFWLVGWAWCASIAGVFLAYRVHAGFGGSMAAAAGLGAVNWCVFLFFFFFFFSVFFSEIEKEKKLSSSSRWNYSSVLASSSRLARTKRVYCASSPGVLFCLCTL
jgi:hypothetical protein